MGLSLKASNRENGFLSWKGIKALFSQRPSKEMRSLDGAIKEGIGVGQFSRFHSEVQGKTRTDLLKIYFKQWKTHQNIKFVTNQITTAMVIPKGHKSRDGKP